MAGAVRSARAAQSKPTAPKTSKGGRSANRDDTLPSQAPPEAKSRPVGRGERFSRIGNRTGLDEESETTSAVLPRLEYEFEVGQLAVHPAHGVGTVAAIEEKDLGGSKSILYVLNIVGSGLRVMVPKIAAARVGLRPVMSADEADEILAVLATAEVAVTVQPWNRRFRAYTEMISSGSAREIAKVLRDMNRLKFDKDLSFGERRLLDQAKGLLVQELALAKATETTEMELVIERIFAA
ncbi:MAG TPA: CarD family transcriptional regulator [Polyangiaceae bacterium]|nr:CarD family transcriptional regulator [Polyangiaceae bacterium]